MFQLIKLALRRFYSHDSYRQLQQKIAETSIADFQKRNIDIPNFSVLELGSGLGGYSVSLEEASRSFFASDIQSSSWFSNHRIPFVQLDSLDSLPFILGTFDLVYCSSLIEHVENPNILLQNIWHSLKPNGLLYLSFPPFYSLSLIGGHQFKPFHLLGEKIAIKLTNTFSCTQYKDYASAFKEYGLHPLTIDQVKKMLLNNHFAILETYTRMSTINTTLLPAKLKDLFTWHVCFIAQRK